MQPPKFSVFDKVQESLCDFTEVRLHPLTPQVSLLRQICQMTVAFSKHLSTVLRLPSCLLAFPDLTSPGNTGHSDQKQNDHVYLLFKTFQWLCFAQRMKFQILNMTYKTLCNLASACSLPSSPKHVALKFFPLIMFPLLLETAPTSIFFLSPWEWCCHPHTLFPQAYLTLRKVLILFSLFPGNSSDRSH